MKLHVRHRTRYVYAAPVRESFNEAHLQPGTSGRQRCHEFKLEIAPATRVMSYGDFYGNIVHQFDVQQPHTELVIDAQSTVAIPDEPLLPPAAATISLAGSAVLPIGERCHDFLQPSTYVDVTPELCRVAASLVAGETDAWQAAQALMRHVHGTYHYQPATTNAHTHMREVLRTHTGVCQDFAHVLLGLGRSLGMPARYVSGYLYNGPTDKLKGAQASHAWVEFFIAGAGWIGLDPTNGQIVGGRHVKVAHGRDYADVPPVKGTYRGPGTRQMTVEVLVSLVEEHAVTSA
jgi:transglutaminase-like putative cysteine protease